MRVHAMLLRRNHYVNQFENLMSLIMPQSLASSGINRNLPEATGRMR